MKIKAKSDFSLAYTSTFILNNSPFTLPLALTYYLYAYTELVVSLKYHALFGWDALIFILLP